MKYLSDYIEEKQKECFKKHGVFFAFSNKQFNEQKQEGVKYVSLGAGIIVPKDNIDTFIDDHHNIVTEGIKQDVAENTIEGVVKRELGNHEAYYTGTIDSTVEALKEYPVTEEQIYKIFRNQNYKIDETKD